MTYERIIKKILRKTTRNNPFSLMNIIGGVDMLDRSIINLIELNESLMVLDKRKLLGFVSPNKFYDLRTDSIDTKIDKFSGITEEEYNEALQEYKKHMKAVFSKNDEEEEEEEDYFIPRITIYWKVKDNSHNLSEEEDERIDDFADLLNEVLAEYKEFEIIGFELGGSYKRILIYGDTEFDKKTDEVYLKIKDVYYSFNCPYESYIVRHYWESGEVKKEQSDFLVKEKEIKF